jgi:hypothetical protein
VAAPQDEVLGLNKVLDPHGEEPAAARRAKAGVSNHEAVGEIIDMPNRRDADSIETQIGRAFEQMIPFNRVLGLKIHSLDPEAPRLRFEIRPGRQSGPPDPKTPRRGIFPISAPSTCASII